MDYYNLLSDLLEGTPLESLAVPMMLVAALVIGAHHLAKHVGLRPFHRANHWANWARPSASTVFGV